MPQYEESWKFCQTRKLLALDMDGTILRHDKTMSQTTKEWLLRARQAGMEFTFATGRHRFGMVESLIKELGIVTPVVTVNGGEVWTPDGELLHRTAFARDEIQLLYEVAAQYETGHWASTTEGPVQAGHFPEPSRIGEFTWVKFGFWSTDLSMIHELWGILEKTDRFELTNSDPTNIEINPRGVNKASGLKVVCDAVGLLPNQVMAFGDSLNDVAMFDFAGCSVAMANAQEQVKDAAKFVTLSCDEDGVAVFLQRLLTETSPDLAD